jgi:hypothetical protein
VCLQVAFDFTVDLSQLSRQGIVEASPMSGKVVAGEKTRIKLKVGADHQFLRSTYCRHTQVPSTCLHLMLMQWMYMCMLYHTVHPCASVLPFKALWCLLQVKAGVPSRLMEPVLVSVAHFEPVQVQVLVEGTYPMLALNLPRIRDDAFLEALQQAQSK